MSDTEAPVEVKRRGRPPKAGSEVAEEVIFLIFYFI